MFKEHPVEALGHAQNPAFTPGKTQAINYRQNAQRPRPGSGHDLHLRMKQLTVAAFNPCASPFDHNDML
jgi:hypothetical protein